MDPETPLPGPEDDLFVDDTLTIPGRELSYRFSRSGGPGGQNVNKVNTRVTLLFSIVGSSALDASQQERVRERLAPRIGADGILRVVAGEHRTQLANRKAARARLARLLADALREDKERRPTRPTPAARRRRMDEKRRRGSVKRGRGRSWQEDD